MYVWELTGALFRENSFFSHPFGYKRGGGRRKRNSVRSRSPRDWGFVTEGPKRWTRLTASKYLKLGTWKNFELSPLKKFGDLEVILYLDLKNFKLSFLSLRTSRGRFHEVANGLVYFTELKISRIRRKLLENKIFRTQENEGPTKVGRGVLLKRRFTHNTTIGNTKS